MNCKVNLECILVLISEPSFDSRTCANVCDDRVLRNCFLMSLGMAPRSLELRFAVSLYERNQRKVLEVGKCDVFFAWPVIATVRHFGLELCWSKHSEVLVFGLMSNDLQFVYRTSVRSRVALQGCVISLSGS